MDPVLNDTLTLVVAIFTLLLYVRIASGDEPKQ